MNLDFRSTQALTGARVCALAHAAQQLHLTPRADGPCVARKSSLDGSACKRLIVPPARCRGLAAPTPRHVIDAAERTAVPAV